MSTEFTVPTSSNVVPETNVKSDLGTVSRHFKNIYVDNIYPHPAVPSSVYTQPQVFNEIPSGTIDGINSNFTLLNDPILNSLALFWNGSLLEETNDYSLIGNAISFVSPPVTNSKLISNYQYSGTLIVSTFSFNETPGGAVDGNNKDYNLAFTPINNSLQLYWNSSYMQIPDDYSLSGNIISFNYPPVIGSSILATYQL